MAENVGERLRQAYRLLLAEEAGVDLDRQSEKSALEASVRDLNADYQDTLHASREVGDRIEALSHSLRKVIERVKGAVQLSTLNKGNGFSAPRKFSNVHAALQAAHGHFLAIEGMATELEAIQNKRRAEEAAEREKEAERRRQLEAERKARERELEAERRARELQLEAERRARERQLEAERQERERRAALEEARFAELRKIRFAKFVTGVVGLMLTLVFCMQAVPFSYPIAYGTGFLLVSLGLSLVAWGGAACALVSLPAFAAGVWQWYIGTTLTHMKPNDALGAVTAIILPWPVSIVIARVYGRHWERTLKWAWVPIVLVILGSILNSIFDWLLA